MSSIRTRRQTFSRLFILGMLVLAIGLILFTGGAFAGARAASPPQTDNNSQSATTGALPADQMRGVDDGFDALPIGLKGISYSTLAHMGKVHYAPPASPKAGAWTNPFTPLLNITWGPERNTSGATAAGEPAAGMHPTNPNEALISGNFNIDNTTDGGNTWTTHAPPNSCNSGDVVNAWLGPSYSGGNAALEMCINNPGSAYDFTCGRSTDGGVTWAADAGCGSTVSTVYFDDREYIWVDRSPTSPFYQRVYATEALFDASGSGSYNSVTLRWSSDGGASWNPSGSNPLPIVAANEYATGVNHNEFPSMGTQPNGTIGYAWHRGLCCGSSPTIGTNNKVAFARSTDGGVTFPFSTTIVTVPLARAIPFNSTSPLGARWSDMPNIAADPSDGTFYTIWTQYRADNAPAGSAIFLSRSTDSGNTWSAPVIPYNNPNASIFQGWGWVKVTPDHTVHVTYLGGTTSNTAVAQFYVQSTDGGATWTAPFQLSSATFGAFGTTTDYEADDVGGYTGLNAGSILAGWAENNHFARIGTFVLGPTNTPTRTATPCSPVPCTSTPTVTLTRTPTPTQTPCGNSADYTIATGTATIVAGTTDIGSHCDDCLTTITLPFTYNLYGQPFTTANVSSNGQLDFLTGDAGFNNVCLPDTTASFAIFPHWDDLNTTAGLMGCASYANGCGVFTSTTGVAPNRIFNIEWHAVEFANNANLANFEVRLYEGQSRFDLVYGTVTSSGVSATVGVQRDTGSLFTQFECSTGGLSSGLLLTFTQPPCGTPLPTSTPTRTSTPTPVSVSVVGHVVWQSLPAQPSHLQEMPITLTIKSGATEVNYTRQLTDQYGFFTVTANLPNGTYNWRAKGNTYLANGGSLVLGGASVLQVDMGLMKAGDLNGDNVTNSVDFTALKNNFGVGGVPPLRPEPLIVIKK